MWFTSLLCRAKTASMARGPAGHRRRKARKTRPTRRAAVERIEERTLLSGGVVLTSLGPDTSDRAYASFLQLGDPNNAADDKIVVAGQTAGPQLPDGHDFAVLRYNADGTPDATFGGGDGVVTTHFSKSTMGD